MFFLLQLPIEQSVCRLFCLAVGALPNQECLIVAGLIKQPAPINSHYPSSDSLQEHPVVGNENQGTRKPNHHLFQFLDGINIHVVSWFIK